MYFVKHHEYGIFVYRYSNQQTVAQLKAARDGGFMSLEQFKKAVGVKDKPAKKKDSVLPLSGDEVIFKFSAEIKHIRQGYT